MQSETKQCQNCKSDFVIEPDDFAFYEKIKVPAPTFCPDCRLQRRLAFFNLRTLYKRVCDLCKKEKISMYPPEAPYKVYCPRCWWSDNWDAYEYGRDYDFSRPFFEQFTDLQHQVPMLGLAVDAPTLFNSPYNNHAGHLKNCYLNFNADFNEDSAYGVYLKKNKSLIDCSSAFSSELCYDSINSFKNSRCIGGTGNVTESLDCAFLRDCDNCQNCFASANLRNKKYYIFNKPYTKEEYFQEIKKWDMGSYKVYQALKTLAQNHWKTLPPRPKYEDFSVNSMGSYVFQSKNCQECFEVEGAENSKFLFMLAMPPLKDLYDISSWGDNLHLSYECSAVGQNASGLKFCSVSGINALDDEYCQVCFGGLNQFGCVGMKKGEYCILNKRYSPEEFKILKEKIISHMNEVPYTDKKGRIYAYGEFFPIELSPFPYNDTMAQNFFPLTQEIAEQEKYIWKEKDGQTYAITKKADELQDHIKDVPVGILDEVIECLKCSRGFKIIKMEFDFLRKMNLPLPRKCPFCRINEKMDLWVQNLTLSKRICDKCGVDFQTHYTKERAPHILCKECWIKEIV